MDTEILLLHPQQPTTFPCFQSEEQSLFPPSFFYKAEWNTIIPVMQRIQVMCFLKIFPPKPPTGQLGPLLSWAAKAFDIFFKVFPLVVNLEKLTLLKFEYSRFTSFRDIENRVFTDLSNAYRAKLFRKSYLHVGLS